MGEIFEKYILKTYRGHIRNALELCRVLGAEYIPDKIQRERILVIKAYEKWGFLMGNHIYGSFSLSIFDREKNLLFCLRDRFGVKPFYYTLRNENGENRLIYADNIRKILSHKNVKKEFADELLQIYLTLTYLPREYTFFRGIKRLLPGHYMIFKDGKINITKYCNLTFSPDKNTTLSDFADEINSLLTTVLSEEEKINSGEYSEAFLSGGVDSSYLFASSSLACASSVFYEDTRFDESSEAVKTAELFGKKCKKTLVTPNDYFDSVHSVILNMEQPLGDASAVALAMACREASKHTKISFSGECADEFFGGYNIYKNADIYGKNLKNFYIGNTNIMREDEKQRLLKRYYESFLPIDILKPIYEENEGLDPLSKMCDVDIKTWLDGDIFLNTDKMSSAYGIDIRMPFSDVRFFEIASRIPSKFKAKDGQSKIAFRHAASKILPKEIAFRKKIGFAVPIRIWLAESTYNADVIRLFDSEISGKFFNKCELDTIFTEFLNGKSENWRKIWTVYVFLVWYEEYFVKMEN